MTMFLMGKIILLQMLCYQKTCDDDDDYDDGNVDEYDDDDL